MAQAANGHLAEAEALLPRATASGDERGQDACAGIVLGRIAGITAVLGRLAEAERLAEQSVRVLEKFYPQNDWVFLRPLQILVSVRLESGNTARAREALRRIRSISIERPEDSAIVHGTVGAMLHLEGRRSEAEAEYQDALRAYEEAGRSESADAAAILHCLSALYLKSQRLDEARQALDRALVIHDRAKDSLPIDRIRFLHLRSVLHARLGEWLQSEQDLRDALSIADRQPYIQADLLRLMLGNYSYVLRRNHHRREARSIEARKATLPPNRTIAAVVDSTELLLERKAAKKESIR
jgi:tetratricopeptide (TPR) repeat protein